MIPRLSEIERIQCAAMALPDAQRAALANALVLSIRDPQCRLAVSLIARNAVTAAEALERTAFIARDARRRVQS